MTEELISKLSRIQGLQVAGRTSVMRFKGAEKDIDQVADELGVRYVLDGSVRKAGDRVRISAQLIDATSRFQLWSDDFDADMKDIFAVQEETALRIAQALDLHLSPGEIEAVGRRYTENPDAYDAYLRGWALVESLHALLYPPEDKLATARRHFERALALESDYAPALAGLAVVEGYRYGFLEEIPEYLSHAEELARRAV